MVDVITSSTVLSSDAVKGLGFVPKYQALQFGMVKKFRKIVGKKFMKKFYLGGGFSGIYTAKHLQKLKIKGYE